MVSQSTYEQSLFSNAFHYAPIGMCLFLPDGSWIMVNPALCKIVGYTENELLRMSSRDITHSEDLDLHKKHVDQLLQGEIETFRIEKRYIHKRGHTIWACLSVSVARDQEGKPRHLIAQILDITEKKCAEEKLQQIEELHQLISKHSQDMIIRATPEGVVSYVSPAVRHQLGYHPEEFIGNYYYDYWHPEDLDHWLHQGNSDSRITAFRFRHKNGHYIWQETHTKKIRNSAGELQHVFGIVRDITERKNIELRLQEIEKRHQSFLKYTPVGICAVDLTGKFMEVNPSYEEMTGYSSDELFSMTFRDVIHPDIKIPQEVNFEMALKGELHDVELVLQTKNGSRIEVTASSSPIIVDEKTVGIYIITKDITEKKQTEELLLKTEKLSLVGELAAGIAHEIRNPLTSLRGFVQLFQREDTMGVKKLHHDVMLSEIDRINEIVSELLVLAKPANETYGPGSIQDKINHVVTLFEGQANLCNIQLSKEFDADLPLIHSHSSLKQVFVNVLKNAIESMPNGGEVRIQAKALESRVCVRIIDKGCGIPQHQLTKIGNPFFTTKEKGTGLGLMVSQRIIQNHKGAMRIESNVGKGTTVEISLPIR